MNELSRFLSKIEVTNLCWNWKASLTNGYGAFRLDKQNGGKLVRANRYSYEAHIGKIPKGQLVLHKCDNRVCVNPEHLFLGTHKENTADMVNKNRHYKPKLTQSQVNEIRHLYATGEYSQKAVGQKYGVSQGMVHFIVSKTQWR